MNWSQNVDAGVLDQRQRGIISIHPLFFLSAFSLSFMSVLFGVFLALLVSALPYCSLFLSFTTSFDRAGSNSMFVLVLDT